MIFQHMGYMAVAADGRPAAERSDTVRGDSNGRRGRRPAAVAAAAAEPSIGPPAHGAAPAGAGRGQDRPAAGRAGLRAAAGLQQVAGAARRHRPPAAAAGRRRRRQYRPT
eukprot:SAG22_NODE_3040_length_2000_cov_10.331931_3_plen_109_part_01